TTTSIKMTTLAIQNLFGYVEEENLAALKAHLDRFKEVDGRSDNGQTPLMLAAEQGSLEILQELIRRGANVNLDDVDCWSALISAAKEGHVDVVKELLENSAYIEHRDMGGWTALMWAAYKGRVEVTELLLQHGANTNTTGQYSVYPIIWAAGRGHAEIVKLLLQNGAKVNCSDKYGTTPLIWASRKGHFDCVMHLLEAGADVDQEGANSMTALIVAVRGGYAAVVKELLKRKPNVNMTDKDGNTALMIAAKEGHTQIVQDLLDAGTYVNIPDRSGDTVLIGAVRGGHVEIVRALLHKYADIDIKGQENKTALYWAVEKGNATMVRDILQCNPDTETCTKDGESPLIKATKMRNVEIVEMLLDKGAKVSAVDKKGDTPLHIAIRGRSRRLAELLLRNPKDGRLLYRPNKGGETPYNIDCSHQKSILTQIFGARHLSPTETDGDVLGYDLYSSALADILSEPTMQPPICVGLYAQWGSGKSFLLKKLEGGVPARKNTHTHARATHTLPLSQAHGHTLLCVCCPREEEKQTCCVPSFLLCLLVLACLFAGLALMAVVHVDGQNRTANGVLVAMGGVVAVALLLNVKTCWRLVDSVVNSQRKRLHGAANRLHKLKSEAFINVLNHQVELMAKMAKTIDFTHHQTRLAVVIDGLDACEQDKVLHMLDTVRVLFSKGPFISIFASDPHIIIKAINQNLNSVLRDSNINGHDYMRNIVHLPVFLNSRGLSSARKVAAAPSTNGDAANADGNRWQEEPDRKLSQHSLSELSRTAPGRRDTYRRRQAQRSVTRQVSVDLSKLMVTEDWFSDISPQTMRRLLNIISLTGRLLRANQITFNWDRLASWINLTEQWPYRTSWLILYLEDTQGVPDHAALKTLYERVSKNIPTTKDMEPLLEIDGDVRSFEVFLSSRTPVLTAKDIRTFLPCTVNLDPKLREVIADVLAAREQMNVGGVNYPPLPLQEVQPRPASVYSQVSSACSPSASFSGAFHQPAGGVASPQPHSSYYSGLSGAQHPFYNRGPFFPHHLCQLPRPLVGSTHPSLHPHQPKCQGSSLKKTQVFTRRLKQPTPSPSPASVVSAASAVFLGSMTTEAICELLRQIDGIDASMLGQYSATVRKANVNGRVLSQCNIDELKKEMSMNFGDWQLFRATVLNMRHMENQLLQEDAASEQGSVVGGGGEAGRRGGAPPPANADGSAMFTFNLSFEELSTLGLEEPARAGGVAWMSAAQRTASMNSLNSQESSNDIGKLTDRQQAEYRSAYQEYIAQMAQLEMGGGGGERPVQPQPGQFMTPPEDKSKDGGEQDGRKAFGKRNGGKAAPDNPDFCSGDLLDPITEEDEHGAARTPRARRSSAERGGLFQGAADLKLKAGGGLRYQKLTSDEHEWEESDSKAAARAPGGGAVLKAKDFLSESTLDKKESSDSGVRSSESSPNHSLQDEEAELSQLERSPLMELQEPAVVRMSICSEDQCSLLASSPEESWPSSGTFNLNRSPSNVTLNNNSHAQHATAASSHRVGPSRSSTPSAGTRPGPNNENVRVVHLKRAVTPGDPPEICTMSCDTVTFSEERESIL
uniref:Kinase D-interacting substrate 220b n=1 Tax=Tetraodon nigroviridis TaxID=99883 RepID=H3DQP1_TETNG